jgi:sorting nexin-9/18/33
VLRVFSEESASYKLLSYSLLGLITSSPLDSGENAAYGLSDEAEEVAVPPQGSVGLVNREGAWCWRDDCEGQYLPSSLATVLIRLKECLALTKALQRTAEYLQNVGDLYDKSVCFSTLDVRLASAHTALGARSAISHS